MVVEGGGEESEGDGGWREYMSVIGFLCVVKMDGKCGFCKKEDGGRYRSVLCHWGAILHYFMGKRKPPPSD